MNKPINKHPIGVVLGRFQVLHHGHMEYILAGKAQCDFLVVGITNPDKSLTNFHASAPHRSLPSSNPLTYYERAIMMRDSLREAGLKEEEFLIVPLPINKPELILNYVPTDAVFLLTVYDDWGRAKVATLQGLGLKVEVLWELPPSQKKHSSTDVREKIAAHLPWEPQVPNAVARYIKQAHLDERIGTLLANQQKS